MAANVSILGKIPATAMPVHHVNYRPRHKAVAPHGPPELLVTYWIGRYINECIALEGTPAERMAATEWWAQRSTLPCPATVADALKVAKELRVPRAVEIDCSGTYVIVKRPHFGDGPRIKARVAPELTRAPACPPVSATQAADLRGLISKAAKKMGTAVVLSILSDAAGVEKPEDVPSSRYSLARFALLGMGR